MRNFLVGLIILSLFISCNKSEEELEIKEFTGEWTLTASCGGFSGACVDSDELNFKSILITEDRFVQKINGQVAIDKSYQIIKLEISETNYPYEKIMN